MITKQFLKQESFTKLYNKLTYLFGLEISMFLSELINKEDFFKKTEDGYFYYTKELIEENTTLSPHKQNQCIKILKKNELISVKKQGIPCKTFYKINHSNLDNLMLQLPDLKILRSCYQNIRNLILKNEELCLKILRSYLYNKDLKKDLNIKNSRTCDLEENSNKDFNKKPSKTKKQIVLQKKYKSLAIDLKNIIEQKRKINKTSSITTWVTSIQNLIEKDLNDPKINKRINRVQSALNFYKEHIGEQYIPVIHSGKALREKFDKLENAMERNKNYNKNLGEFSPDESEYSLDKIKHKVID